MPEPDLIPPEPPPPWTGRVVMDFVVMTECEIDVHDACCDEEAAVSEARERMLTKMCKRNPGCDVELMETLVQHHVEQREES